MEQDRNIRLDQADHNRHSPRDDGLIIVRNGIIIIPAPHAELFPFQRAVGWRTLGIAPGAGSKHQGGGCDPEEEDEDFGRQASDGVDGAAAREGVRAVVGESRSCHQPIARGKVDGRTYIE